MAMMDRWINNLEAVLADLTDEDLTTEHHCDLDELDGAITSIEDAINHLRKGQQGKCGIPERGEFLRDGKS